MSAFSKEIAASAMVGTVPNLFTMVMAVLALGPGGLRSEDTDTAWQTMRQLEKRHPENPPNAGRIRGGLQKKARCTAPRKVWGCSRVEKRSRSLQPEQPGYGLSLAEPETRAGPVASLTGTGSCYQILKQRANAVKFVL